MEGLIIHQIIRKMLIITIKIMKLIITSNILIIIIKIRIKQIQKQF
jgi:hypothetical protein